MFSRTLVDFPGMCEGILLAKRLFPLFYKELAAGKRKTVCKEWVNFV